MEFGDIAPSQPVHEAVKGLLKDFGVLEKTWKTILDKDLKTLNEHLAKASLPVVAEPGK
jgi:hypothetical protein